MTRNFKAILSLASLLIVIGGGFIQLIYSKRTENFSEPFEGSNYGKLTSAFYAGLFPYSGW